MLARAHGINRVGDRRGINGVQSDRGTNGRFVSKRARDDSVAAPASHAQNARKPPESQPDKPHDQQGREAEARMCASHPLSCAPDAPPQQPQPLRQPPQPRPQLQKAPRLTAPQASGTPPAGADTVLSRPLQAQPKPEITPGSIVATVSTTASTATTLTHADDSSVDDVPLETVDLVRMARDKAMFQHRFVCDFSDLSSTQVLNAIEEGTLPSPWKGETYFSHLIYQCAYDRRDCGKLLPHVVYANDMLPLADFRVTDADICISTVVPDDAVTLALCGDILAARAVLVGKPADIDADMQVYVRAPYHMLAASRNGKIEGVCAFRAHTLNTHARLITLELLATASNARRGVGSAIMRVVRELSQITPRSAGFVAASCLKTNAARKFYQRKLPEASSPQARAFLVSLACSDPDTRLMKHLELRCVSVWP